MLLLLAVYGLRSGEVRALKLENLDWEKNLIWVPRAKGPPDAVLSAHRNGRGGHPPLPGRRASEIVGIS